MPEGVHQVAALGKSLANGWGYDVLQVRGHLLLALFVQSNGLHDFAEVTSDQLDPALNGLGRGADDEGLKVLLQTWEEALEALVDVLSKCSGVALKLRLERLAVALELGVLAHCVEVQLLLLVDDLRLDLDLLLLRQEAAVQRLHSQLEDQHVLTISF